MIAPGTVVGFIGLGRMGYPMAARLAAAGFAIRAYDLREEAARAFASETGCERAASLKDFKDAEAVIAILPNSAAVRDAVDGGLGEALRPGALLIDMTSGSPSVTRALARPLIERGIAVMDAPVSGGVKGAADGRLAIMVGGEPEALERARPVLERMGTRIFHVGPLGAGQAMKALNNLVSASGLAAAAEAVSIGRRFGLDPEVMIDILNASTGRNNSTENKFKPFILSGSYAGGFALGLMVKDLGVAVALADETGATAELSRACLDVWSSAERGLPAGADHTEIARWIDRVAERRDAAE